MNRVITSIRYSIICCDCKKTSDALQLILNQKNHYPLKSLHDLRPTPPLPLDMVHHIFQEVPFKTTCIYAYSNGTIIVFRCFNNFLDSLRLTNISGLFEDRGTGFCSFYCSFIMKVNVCDNWNINFFNNFRAKLDSSSGHESYQISANVLK